MGKRRGGDEFREGFFVYLERHMKYTMLVVAFFILAMLSRYKGYEVPDQQVLLYVNGLSARDMPEVIKSLNEAKIEGVEPHYPTGSVRLPLSRRAEAQALLIERGLPREVGQSKDLTAEYYPELSAGQSPDWDASLSATMRKVNSLSGGAVRIGELEGGQKSARVLADFSETSADSRSGVVQAMAVTVAMVVPNLAVENVVVVNGGGDAIPVKSDTESEKPE